MLGSTAVTAGIALAAAAVGLWRRPPLSAPRPPLLPLAAGCGAGLLAATPGLLRRVDELQPSHGDMIWHAAWIHQLADGMAAPGGVYAGEPNSYPWLYHALAAWVATALPGGTGNAIAVLELFGLVCAGTGMWLLACELRLRPAAAGWSVVLFLAGASFGWLGDASPDVHAPIPSLQLGPFHGDPVPALTPALAYLPPMIPRDLGLALAPIALWLAVAAARSGGSWWRAGGAGGLVFLASPLAGLFCAVWFAGGGEQRMPRDARDLVGDAGRRQHEVDAAGGDRAARHAGVLGRIVLREGDATGSLDLLHALRAVGGAARQDHADGLVPLLLRERAQEPVDGPVLSRRLGSRQIGRASCRERV